MPPLSVMLIDGTRKKVNFLKNVLRILKLKGIEAHQIRAENLLEDPTFVESFDVIISRAVSSLEHFVKMALPLLAKLGSIMAMKGKVNQKELDAIRSEFLVDRYSLEVQNYKLPSIEALRSIIIIKHLY
jgi:16S rRNA (guanine527-N7)-methyltransferase